MSTIDSNKSYLHVDATIALVDRGNPISSLLTQRLCYCKLKNKEEKGKKEKAEVANDKTLILPNFWLIANMASFAETSEVLKFYLTQCCQERMNYWVGN